LHQKEREMSRLINTVVPLAAALVIASGVANAQPQPGYGPGYGPGPGMMGGPGSGYGAGPGMGPGPGGGEPGYGPRGGYGPGPYGGGGMGPGMGGYGADRMLDALNLTDAQRADVNKIRDDVRRKNWDLLGKMQDEQAKLRDLYAAEKLDRPAISAAYKRLGDLRQQRIDNMLEANEKIDAILSPEQRKQLRRWGLGWAQ
jgi:Spy/CpxP family protein refolding chaperone